ncbi:MULTISPECIES: hypothetical protein [Flavobacterium]|jgi:hypothetical protein|uniref:Beta-lactamase-inhibitor-like PepSY-like domain-containing protein n=2 Tax=Flavobacterium TaxID=237 RepID=A0A940X8I6_9FLAO|nr:MULTISPECIES: hypothetical protein [Flavobacterium]MBP4138151.1 hypothetical protein [Flavobacterium geliluteum]MDX6180658.1 hypothetical protein [Flavobacterium sp. Fl-33]MDX6184258.1 hypothetical protein [Flavobacterium sp. Fl-77]UFH39370.1 hypothetical protein LNP22_03630 [Flavobacterium sp. F-70]
MKKLILSAVIIVLGTLFTNAEAAIVKKSVLNVENVQDDYKEIKADALPAEVKATLEKSFPNSKLVKAYVNGKKQYKLELNSGEDSPKHYVFTDAKGVIAEKY